ncbi:MAG: small nuclear ribonucleoprotein (snRNP)-like protein [Parvicellaceae bacterium]|jgi:small nuclear ribonucleoprotein (snRNP)-like protein
MSLPYKMPKRDLKEYYNRECRFKLKSGQEIYGVLWEVESATGKGLYFTSLFNATKLRSNNDFEMVTELGQPMKIDQIILAERLVS